MEGSVRLIDLLDPDPEELARESPVPLHERAVELLTAPTNLRRLHRPTLEGHDAYVLGLFLVVTALPDEDRVVYQEVGFVLTHDVVVVVRKTPPDHEPFDVPALHRLHHVESAGMLVYRLVDEIAERFLDLVDRIIDEIDEIEEHVDEWEPRKIRARLSELRHDLLRTRRTLAPTRDAVHRVADGRVDVEANDEVFDRHVELHFADAYDKFLRATDGLDLSRDLLAGVRDYYQANIAIEQNEVTKKLAAFGAMLLVPTFIVGLYGQNFRNIPELHWGFGYAFSWALIVLATLAQIAFFRRLRWL
jgi:magnesium transporter